MKKLCFISIIAVSFFSCKKDKFKEIAKSSLSVTNVVVGGTFLRLGSINAYISPNSYSSFTLPAGNNDLYVWPYDDSLHPYFTTPKFNAEENASYSLWLGGTPSSVDGVLIKDNFPIHNDSTCGIRFVNMSPNSTGFNITLATSPSVTEVSNLQYKQYTDFKIYSAKAAPSNYQFQIRNATDNSVILTYPFSHYRFANVTIVIGGMVNGSPSLGIITVNNDR